jgi:histidine ammonia-lyase
MSTHHISANNLTLAELKGIVKNEQHLALSEASVNAIMKCRRYLDDKINNSEQSFYGINTGFGSLYNVRIDKHQVNQLQENLVMSHACGMGAEVPAEIVRLMLLLKVQSLSYGHSGVDLSTMWRLIDFYNLDINPVVYEQGSLGASGDLAPLAHLCLPLIGKGEVIHNGQRLNGQTLKDIFKFNPLHLQSKEGLALLNGTQFMSAYGVWCIWQAEKLLHLADIIGLMSLEAFDGRPEPFDNLVQQVRPHSGQSRVGAHFVERMQDSGIMTQAKAHVQDPYSFRCIPQVHGASRDVLTYVQQVFETEINSVTDNPLVFPDEDRIISGGNFHGQTLALALDTLALAMSEIANISERRIYKLISGERGLPPYLVSNSGLNSGFMIPQYTAAGIVSQNKQLCTPASADSIVSSNGQEDHVSMGANAATKCYRVMQNVQTVLAIELLNAAQALDFRGVDMCSTSSRTWHQKVRAVIPFVENDTVLHNLMQTAVDLIASA